MVDNELTESWGLAPNTEPCPYHREPQRTRCRNGCRQLCKHS